MLIPGGCHCGNIRFSLLWEPEPAQIAARACTCSFCTKHGGVWTSCPTGSLKVMVRDPALVTRYEFATKSAQFHVCSRCGVVPLVTGNIGERLYAVVNVNAFEDVPASMLSRAPTSFDGETPQDRLARRARVWIPDVEFVASAPAA